MHVSFGMKESCRVQFLINDEVADGCHLLSTVMFESAYDLFKYLMVMILDKDEVQVSIKDSGIRGTKDGKPMKLILNKDGLHTLLNVAAMNDINVSTGLNENDATAEHNDGMSMTVVTGKVCTAMVENSYYCQYILWLRMMMLGMDMSQ
nr:hypothetical protein [Tanacetum cinerariifolium]